MASVTDLAVGLRSTLQASQEPLQPMGLQSILLGEDALSCLAEEVASVARFGRIVVLEDATPMTRGGEDLKDLVAELLATVGVVERVVIGPPDGHARADSHTLEVARTAAGDAGCVVSVGSGTLTDVGKDASCANGGLPLVAVQTAASVNGFADNLGVILKDGVKRTVPMVWPSALIVDTQVLRDAPVRLTRSGFGEMMAMFTAPGDWRLSSLVGLDPSYSRTAIGLFKALGEDLLELAPEVAAGTNRGLDLLATLLTVSGVAMGVAGRTAILSGAEHLISHLLDMSAVASGSPIGLHGAQVGVGALVAACIWERLLDELDADELRSDLAFPDPADIHPQVISAFRWLDADGAAAEECWTGYRRKLRLWHQNQPQVDLLADRWEQVATELRSHVGDPEEMATALAASGAPTTFRGLGTGVDADRARWAVKSSHLMRDRFTVVDLAHFTGHWSDDDIDAVLARAAEIGGGL